MSAFFFVKIVKRGQTWGIKIACLKLGGKIAQLMQFSKKIIISFFITQPSLRKISNKISETFTYLSSMTSPGLISTKESQIICNKIMADLCTSLSSTNKKMSKLLSRTFLSGFKSWLPHLCEFILNLLFCLCTKNIYWLTYLNNQI
jgi:hypothetical protein